MIPIFPYKRYIFFLAEFHFVSGLPDTIMHYHQENDNYKRNDCDDKRDQKQSTFEPNEIVVFSQVPHTYTVDKYKQTGQGFSVNENLDEDNLWVWRDVLANGRNEGDKRYHNT